MKKLLTLIVSFLTIFSLQTQAQNNCFPQKNNYNLVYDQSDILSAQEEDALRSKLNTFAKKTSTQMVIVIVDDICDMSPEQYATKIGYDWGVGQADKDNGIVILVKPSGGQGERKTFIAVGYGLEAVIPDGIGVQIVNNELLPNFKNGKFYAGLDAATTVIQELSLEEYSAQEYVEKSGKVPLRFYFIFIAIILFVIFSRLKAARKYSKSNNIGLWAALMLMS